MKDLVILRKSINESDFDNKEELLNILKSVENNLKNKKYGLIWEDKPEYIKESLKNNFIYLEEDIEKRISLDNNEPENILIEGDNLESLMALQYTHKGLVDVIYIDPPYNTGNGDFVYNDKFVDKENSWRHSCWLSFMHKRLLLAKDLLSDDGVIFISIDDNEQAQLKLLCDEIFGENNFLSTIHWRKNRKPHNAGNTMSTSHEFIHVYVKKNKIKLVQDYSEMKTDEKGNYSIYPILQGDKKVRIYTFPKGTICECATLRKGIVSAKNNKLLDIEILDDVIVNDNVLMNDIRIKGRYRLTDENGKLSLAIKNNNIFINSNGFPKEKRYRKDEDFKVDNHYWDLEKGKNEDGNDLIKDIFGITNNNIFTYPKPIALLKKILTCINNKNAVVLDFFAGSGTTGHAVVELNKEDGGYRKFILCTNNEENICEEVTYQRMNKIINGYTNQKGKEVEGIPSNLRYYRTKKIEKTNNNELDQFNLLNKTLELIQIKENAFEITKSNNYYSILNNDEKIVGLYSFGFIDSIEIENMLDELIKNNKENKVAYIPVEDVSEIYDYIDDKYIGLVRFEKMPKELIEIYNKLNRS